MEMVMLDNVQARNKMEMEQPKQTTEMEELTGPQPVTEHKMEDVQTMRRRRPKPRDKREGDLPTQEEREYVLDQLKPEEELFHPLDFREINNNTHYFNRFWFHSMLMPGDHLEDCLAVIRTCLRWREDFGVRTITEDDLDIQDKKVGGMFIRNRDRQGSKLLIFCVKRHVKDSSKSLARKKYLIYHLERLQREEKGEQICILFDCEGGGIKNMDIENVQFLVQALLSFYPFMVKTILVLEMPWVLNTAWKIIKPLLPGPAVQKIKFLTRGTLTEYIDEDNQLTAWGGRDTWQYVWEPQLPSQPPESVETDLMQVVPLKFLEFVPSSDDLLEAEIQVKNISTVQIVYKVKTTSPDIFVVKSHTDFILPNQTQSIRVSVAVGQRLSNEKFQVLSTPAAVGTETSASSAFRNGESYQEVRIACRTELTVTNSKGANNLDTLAKGLPFLMTKMAEIDRRMEDCQAVLSHQMILNIVLLVTHLLIYYLLIKGS